MITSDRATWIATTAKALGYTILPLSSRSWYVITPDNKDAFYFGYCPTLSEPDIETDLNNRFGLRYPS